MTEREFWNCTPETFAAFQKAHIARERRISERFAALMALTANCNRDPEKTPDPFKTEDFLPSTAKRRKRKAKAAKADVAFFQMLEARGLAHKKTQ